MGAVFRALDPKLDRKVALKILPLYQDLDPDVVQRFLEEGRSAARLDHENVARVHAIGQDGPYHYIAFEYIEGETVRQRVEATGPLPPALAISITLEIARALVHAASRGVVHRDVKPSNIILTPHGEAKLVDMGLARRFEREGDQGLTQSGVTLGTFDYISPEQARDPRDVDVRSDLYSLGCTLFHMLTGHPPFPGGTWLQKLIQHQEERPPDPRVDNPDVPPALAALTMKLMAKDRERRCQTPEILVRELLAIAGELGIEAVVREGRGWVEPWPRPAWERHAAWMAPAAGFLILLAGLVFWSRDSGEPLQPRPDRVVVAPRTIEPGRTGDLAATANPRGGEPAPTIEPAPYYPRTIPVSSSEDLLEILAQAPPRSVVVLADDGPYRLGGRAWSSRPTPALANLDVAVKAEAGVRPLIKFASDAFLAERPPTALLEFLGGRIVLEGLDFEVESAPGNVPLAAIKIDDAELTVRGCLFRRPSSQGAENVAALFFQAPLARSWTERPPAVVVDACHFDGDQIGVRTAGPAEVVLRDCTMGPGAPSFLLGDPARPSIAPVELRLLHTSILAGETEVFHPRGPVRLWVDDCVVARSGARPGVLVALADLRELVWRGRSNLYFGIGDYLRVDGSKQPVDFAHWSDAADLREIGGRELSSSAWAAADPAQALKKSRDNPSRAFQLAAAAGTSTAGARQGPLGAIPRPPVSTLETKLAANDVPTRPLEPTDVVSRPGARGFLPDDEPANSRIDREPRKDPGDDPIKMPTMPPTEPDGRSPGGAEASPGNPTPAVPPAAQPNPTDREPDRALAKPDPAMIHDSARLAEELKKAGQRGGTITIAPGSRIDIAPLVLEGEGRREIIAGAGGERPRLRLRVPSDSPTPPDSWIMLFDLRSGSLRLKGLDLIVAEPEPSASARVAALGVAAGAELVLEGCTVTVASSRPGSAALVAAGSGLSPRPLEAGTPRDAVVRLRDCFLRSGGDGVAVAGGRRLDLELDNTIASTEGSLIHAYGSAPNAAGGKDAVKLRIDQSTARVKGGLVHLDSTRDAPRTSSAAIVAEASIMSTAQSADPLMRLDGQGQLDELDDKIRWEGRNVAYDHVKTYRRDEVVGPGAFPRVYDRAGWLSAFRPKDDSPNLADISYANPAASSLSAWKLEKDNLRLAPGGPAIDSGPDLGRVPDAPKPSSL